MKRSDFDVHNSSIRQSEYHKNYFLILDEGPNDDINDNAGEPEKTFNTNFTIWKTKICLNLHYKGNNSYLYINKTQFANSRSF